MARSRQEVYFCGGVQGVGFRWTTRRIAHDFDIVGFVRNLHDGRVHLVAEGEAFEVEAFVAAVSRDLAGHIADREVMVGPPTGGLSRFEIR